MKPEHFRALNFKGYINEYQIGRIYGKNLSSTKRRWSYQVELNMALSRGLYPHAAKLLGIIDTLSEDTPFRVLARRFRSTPITDSPIQRNSVRNKEKMFGKATNKKR